MKMNIYHYFKHRNDTMPTDKYWQREKERVKEMSKNITAV